MRTGRLVHRWLRVAGTITWAVIGGAFASFFIDWHALLVDGVAVGRWIAWAIADFGFLALLWLETGEPAARRRTAARVAMLAAQTLCALAIAGLPQKPVGFIFLTIVAAQMAFVLAPRAAAAWILLQSLAMGWIYWHIVPAWEAQSYVAVYLGFQAFAHIVVRAALSEAAARDDLARMHAELGAKEALLAESRRLAERARISQDLHDVLGHHLAAMSLNLEVAAHLTNGAAQHHVEQARTLTVQLLKDVREVVTEMQSDRGCDLGPALAKLVAGLPRPAIHLDVAAAARVVADVERAEALLRCAQEAVTNALLHSGCSNLWITLRRGDGAEGGVELAARDDGRGTERIEHGVGLRGLAERFARLGGRVELASATGRGFEVRAWLP